VVNIQKLRVVIKKHVARYHKHGKLISITMGSEMQVALSDSLQDKQDLT
jgi:hypothetical protein